MKPKHPESGHLPHSTVARRICRRLTALVFAVLACVSLYSWGCSANKLPTTTRIEQQAPTPPPSDSAAAAISDALQRAHRFILKEGDSFRLDLAAAEAAGLSAADIHLGTSVALLATQSLNNIEPSNEAMAELQPFFAWVGEQVEESQAAIRAESPQSNPFEKHEAHGSASPFGITIHCPPRAYMSVVDARAWLLSRGYHEVPAYAGGNYAKFINTSHWPASAWPFWTYRNQGVVLNSNHGLMLQDVEPNPELGAYPWWVYPGEWWGPFVYAWHRGC